MSTDTKSPPNRLKELREEANLSQGRLSMASGVLEKTIRRVELGHTSPNLSTAQALARALGVTVTELFPEPEAQTA